MGRKALAVALILAAPAAFAADVSLPGLKSKVEILIDQWGVPHIYAQNAHDLFYAQGWTAARDRLFQIDRWRRLGVGRMAEVLGPNYVARDRIARLVRFRGNWNEEWQAYSPDARAIAMAFTRGINDYVASLKGKRTPEFAAAGYDPGVWQPEDVTARIAGLQMLRNATYEITRALEVQKFGLEKATKLRPPDPPVKLELPKGLDLSLISADIVRDYQDAIGAIRREDGSNNWVIDGTLSVTGKPLLASDPHRTITLPSLRKTVHLVAPGWDVIGAGEPALPGIALGHNEEVAWGFTIVGIDQQDLYIEKLNPANLNQYSYKGAWRELEVEKDTIPVKGAPPANVELKYTIHGPVIYEDRKRGFAVALRWAGAEPGGAGYLSALRLSRTKNWTEFRQAAGSYKTPSENLLYADRAGNIGWIASGLSPIRKNWTGLLPVPGHTGEYEWSGYLTVDQLPQNFNPKEHFLRTANANHLPPGYPHQIGFEFAPPFRGDRVVQMLTSQPKFSIQDFQRMQHDVTSLPAQRFQKILANWNPSTDHAQKVKNRLLQWDAQITADSYAALIFETWMLMLPRHVFGAEEGRGVQWPLLLDTLAAKPDPKVLAESLDSTLAQLEKLLGPEGPSWRWGAMHQLTLNHPLAKPNWSLKPIPRAGDANTVMAAGWPASQPFRSNHGASYREILDPSNWDNSVVTNTPGESGDPGSPHYQDLFADWAAGRYHPLPYSREAVEKATRQRMTLLPAN